VEMVAESSATCFKGFGPARTKKTCKPMSVYTFNVSLGGYS
jgi:hypothetical protein